MSVIPREVRRAAPNPHRPLPHHAGRPRRFRWWMPNLAVAATAVALVTTAAITSPGTGWAPLGSPTWWLVTLSAHLPFGLILLFLVGGFVERLGYFRRGRAPVAPGWLPPTYPSVCVQLPMFNEHAVARRVIEAAAAIRWPRDRFSVQVLDDSTDLDTRALVEAVCAEVRATGVDCRVLHRADRRGYKAGALEEGRRRTDADYLAIFDADFLPTEDFLLRAIPHFYLEDGRPDPELALVQAQWGHLNHDESALTMAQSLWVDDHHTLQMSWRAAKWRFVNFTGTAGIWRAAAVEAAGGWRAASLVEDCELSFRHLFAGFRTTFVKEIVVPAELPATYTAYKAQQKRWTQGWVQLQRLHLATLLFRFRTTPLRRLHLVYHMCIPWQWPAWALWILSLPFLIHTGHWFGALGAATGAAVYLAPTVLWLTTASVLASIETRHTYRGTVTARTLLWRLRRVLPYAVLNTGMLPHQYSAFTEGLFGPMHSEFERTPKAATVTTALAGPTAAASGAIDIRAAASGAIDIRAAAPRRYGVKVHWPYVLAELLFVAYQAAWTVLFLRNGLPWCAAGAAFMGVCVLAITAFYGDHVGKRCFVIDRDRLRLNRRPAGTRRRSASGRARR